MREVLYNLYLVLLLRAERARNWFSLLRFCVIIALHLQVRQVCRKDGHHKGGYTDKERADGIFSMHLPFRNFSFVLHKILIFISIKRLERFQLLLYCGKRDPGRTRALPGSL